MEKKAKGMSALVIMESYYEDVDHSIPVTSPLKYLV